MIKFSNQVPSVYPSASRDFQYLGWLIDIVLNSVKHNVDDMYNLPNNKADPKLTELLAMTLGFKVKRNYDQAQLTALIAALPRILKYKGTKTALVMAGNALIAASGASGDFTVEEIQTGEIKVTFPKTLVDVSLFTDLLVYILPAGMTCRIDRTDRVSRTYSKEYTYSERLIAKLVPGVDWDDSTQSLTGLASLYSVPSESVTFANFNSDTPNIGLLDNTIIPSLEQPVIGPGGPAPTEKAYIESSNEYGTTVTINDYTTEATGEGNTVIIEDT